MPKILIVDDEWLTRLEIEEMLNDLGYEVAGLAETGEEAIEMARELNPDLILMDVKMPGGMNGIDAARVIKAELGIPIVFISGYGDPEYIEAAKEIAPFGYVMKPFDVKEVHAFVEIALSKRELELKLEKAHEILEQNNLDLQKEITAGKKTERALRKEKFLSDAIIENTPAGIAFLDNNFVLRRCNRVYAEQIECHSIYPSEQALGMSYFDYAPGSRSQVEEWFQKVRDTGQVETRYGFELLLEVDGQKETSYWDTSIAPVPQAKGNENGILILTQDVTEHKKAEEDLQEINKMLEQKVKERTEDMEKKTHRLTDVNAALNVLLEKRDEDKKRLEQDVLQNVQDLIQPLIDNLSNSGLNSDQTGYLKALESFLGEIISPFSSTLKAQYRLLTPSEIRVANLIRQGKSTKDMAQLLNSTDRAIKHHRRGIRRKLGLVNEKVNLESHLASLM